MIKAEKLEISINGETIEAYTVKEFYRKIFLYLITNDISFESLIPYATGNTSYLINWKNEHINRNAFTLPLLVDNYYIDTYKSKNGALRDILKFLTDINVDVKCVKKVLVHT